MSKASKYPMFKDGADVQVGDVLRVWWQPNRDTVVSLEPYRGTLPELKGSQSAGFAASKVGMTLVKGSRYEVIGFVPQETP